MTMVCIAGAAKRMFHPNAMTKRDEQRPWDDRPINLPGMLVRDSK
jgi:hypothetical protein